MRRAAAFLFVLALCGCAPAVAAAAGAPTIQYSTPSPIRNHEATLRFAVDPEGLETSYEVMYGKVGESYRPLHEPLDGVLPTGDDPVSLAKLLPIFFEGPLQAGTEYHWRVVAKNAAGETVGGDQVFTTANGPKPTFVSGSATQTGPESMAFSGTVNPEGAPLTGCRFRFVDAETFHYAGFEKAEGEGVARFGRTVPCEESFAEIGSVTHPVAVHAEADEIEPGEYFFRLEGENAYEDATAFGGTSFELVEGVPPSIEYSEPDPIRNHEAVLRFSIDPGGLETTYDLEWARSGEEFTDWGMHGAVPAGEGPEAQEVKVPRYWEGGLAAGQEFHWRVRAWNAEGETVGAEQFFTTTDGPDPEVANGTATQTEEGTVELTGTVDPEGVPLTDCEFRYLDLAGYYHGFDWHDSIEQIRIGTTVPCEESPEEIGSGSEPVTVHAELTGLHPGKWFFRVEADNQYESSPLLAGTSFQVVSPFPPPPPPAGPAVPPGVNPPGIDKAPGLVTAPGLSKAPGLQKARKRHAKRLRRNATIVAPLNRFKQRQR